MDDSAWHGLVRLHSKSIQSLKSLPSPINNTSIYVAIQRAARQKIIEEKLQ